jgi:hypothetical protein
MGRIDSIFSQGSLLYKARSDEVSFQVRQSSGAVTNIKGWLFGKDMNKRTRLSLKDFLGATEVVREKTSQGAGFDWVFKVYQLAAHFADDGHSCVVE